MAIKVKYEPGKTLKESYFIVSEGDQVKKVKASHIIPWEIQEKILKGDKDVKEPEEICKEFETKFSSLSEFRDFVRQAKRENFDKKLREKLAKKGIDKKADFILSVNEAEKVDEAPKGELSTSVQDESAMDGKQPVPKGMSGAKRVRDYYARVRNTGGGGEPEKSINIMSSLLKAKRELRKLQSELEEKNKIIQEFQEKERVDRDSKLVASVIFELKKAGILSPDKETTEKAIELIAKMNTESVSALKSLITLFTERKNETAEKKEVIASKNIPQTLLKDISTEMEKIEELSELMSD